MIEKRQGKEEKVDDDSVSDDSLEVIVVKKSLEKKYEKTISGRKLPTTPKESTRETTLTKVHKRSSKRQTQRRSNDKSKLTSDDERDEMSPDGRKKGPGESTMIPPGEDEEDSETMESRYEKDATDSTSQETVKRVVVTAMVHKDQIPHTPKSTLETNEAKSDVSKKATDGTEETFENDGEKLRHVKRSSSRMDQKTQESNEKAKTGIEVGETSDKGRGESPSSIMVRLSITICPTRILMHV